MQDYRVGALPAITVEAPQVASGCKLHHRLFGFPPRLTPLPLCNAAARALVCASSSMQDKRAAAL
jgi:hypothetical protein